MATPKISIICPILNVRTFIAQTIESALAQTYENWELVIMDGASTDGTLDVIRPYAEKDSRIRLYSEKDEGVWPALEKGIQLAHGDFITVVCGQDGFVDRDWFAKVAQIFETDPEVALVWGLGIAMTEDGVLVDEVHDLYSRFEHPQGMVNSFWAAVRKFFSTVRDLLFGSSLRRKVLLRTIFAKTFFLKLNFHIKREMPGGQTPQKKAWFRYWLDTATVFPDESMVIDKRVFLECAPRYGEVDGELGPMVDFYFNFNARGYLPWYIPSRATFGRIHSGASGERRPFELLNTTERYLERILVLRKKVLRKHEPVAFRARNGKVLATERF